MKNNKPIYVTQPSLAPLEDYMELLKGVWKRGVLTHNGPLVQQLEKELLKVLNIKQIVAVTNGTIAIQLAIKALGLKGEIITTPFTWVATISAIIWENCTPIFADIDARTLNIDPAKIEEKLTPQTSAIMPVHVFGNACNVDEIEAIAKKYNLRVIYDAAHAVGTIYKGRSLLEYGDISATSFHATKLLNTGEGGACITNDNELYEKLRRIRFFGHDNSKDVVEDGCNGKMTEIHAALGLANLRYYDQVLADRKEKYLFYKERLKDIGFLTFQNINEEAVNYSYLPVVFDSEERLLEVERALNMKNIFPRRYFYPSVNTYQRIVPYDPMPISENVSRRILCLPLYFKLNFDVIETVIAVIQGF
ncbi:MAG: DegT/DnrJ/EryC1/StrS family aminotransferase [Proteobacteria bacterium]|nr:DegT/DnrJ/EryC1/StrS family aminotransferase [Pseudomonadota bacterium]